jgi:hypothetical protein
MTAPTDCLVTHWTLEAVGSPHEYDSFGIACDAVETEWFLEAGHSSSAGHVYEAMPVGDWYMTARFNDPESSSATSEFSVIHD